jgi:AbiV family abortive infection protein
LREEQLLFLTGRSGLVALKKWSTFKMLPDTAKAHYERYWQRARETFLSGDYPLAAFLAITLIEEVGKIVILSAAIKGEPDAKKEFRNHQSKYANAVWATLAVNSRVTRIYGRDEARFAEWFRNENLFQIRNSALYLELQGSRLVAPSEVINREDAQLLTCIAGEIYAEIQGSQAGTGPAEWERILSEIDAFRSATSLAESEA